MFKNRSKVLFVGSLLATIYVIYLIIYFSGSMQSNDTSEALGGALATALVTPHMLMMGLGTIFSWVGFGLRKAGFALVGAILYSVAALVYAPICIPMIILGFVGYAKQLKISKNIN